MLLSELAHRMQVTMILHAQWPTRLHRSLCRAQGAGSAYRGGIGRLWHGGLVARVVTLGMAGSGTPPCITTPAQRPAAAPCMSFHVAHVKQSVECLHGGSCSYDVKAWPCLVRLLPCRQLSCWAWPAWALLAACFT